MIRVRFPAGVEPPRWLGDRPGAVEVTRDPAVVAAEGEKNGSRQSAAVDRVLRPAFRRMWSGGPRTFGLVSVETRAGCNYGCTFCAVSRHADPRRPGELSLALLDRIAGQLADLSFGGRVSLFGNNEPLLDTRIVGIVGMFRSTCAPADLRLLTNGTRATADLVTALFEAGLTTLVINNYTDGRRLIRPVRDLIGSADRLAPYDIRISVRSRTEVLTTRAGSAPNKPVPETRPRGFCALPFTDLHIAYTGDVTLCCFDAYGRVPMGNVADTPLTEIWRSERFAAYRQRLLSSVRGGLCETCDFDGFRDPRVGHRDPPLTRDALDVQEPEKCR